MANVRAVLTTNLIGFRNTDQRGSNEAETPLLKALEAVKLASNEDEDAPSGGQPRLKEEPSVHVFEKDHERSWEVVLGPTSITKEEIALINEQSRQVRGSDGAIYCFR